MYNHIETDKQRKGRRPRQSGYRLLIQEMRKWSTNRNNKYFIVKLPFSSLLLLHELKEKMEYGKGFINSP